MEQLRLTMGDLLNDVASRFPENETLVDLSNDIRLTYREFLTRVNDLARGFLKLGIQKGDHLALWSPNRWEWIVTEFAIARIGAVLVSVDTHAQRQQLEYVLRQSDSRALIMAGGAKGSEYLEMARQLPDLPELRHTILMADHVPPGMIGWETLLKMGRDGPAHLLYERERACRADDVVTLLYTSGTTGVPKGVMSTHFGILNATAASAEIQRLTEKDRLCLSVPLSHMFGCVCITLAAVIKGAALVLPSETFEPGKILEAIERERCTAIYGSPTAFISLMEHPKYAASNIRSLRTGIMGGAQCPMEVMKKVVEEMGVKDIIIGYGLTESSSWITETRPDDPLELRVSTVGRPIPNVEVKIMDPKTGEEVPAGMAGELCARGLNMKGYYKMAAATEKAVDREGWLHSGDLAVMDEKGYVRMTGRLKEVIQRGTETIYPAEIEEILFAFSGISNAQVFGVPDQALGEEIAAWIKLEEGASVKEEEILRFCREKLPPSQVPRYLKFVKEFPMTPLGKVQKFKLREMASEEYGLKG